MFGTDRVRLEKQDGTHIDDIAADVQPTMIFINDGSLPIEEGDKLVRTLPNGLVERYVVQDRGFWSQPGGIGAHYQAKVRKETSIAVQQQAATTIYNLQGANNPRVNVNSFDTSVNVVTTSPTDLFTEIKNAIAAGVADAGRKTEMLTLVEDLEQAQGTPSFWDRYAKLIGGAADHLTLLTPFLPALTQMLSAHHP